MRSQNDDPTRTGLYELTFSQPLGILSFSMSSLYPITLYVPAVSKYLPNVKTLTMIGLGAYHNRSVNNI